MKTIKIVLAENELLFREAISVFLKNDKNLEIVQTVSDGYELISFLRKASTVPDIIIMDVKMPRINGIEATRIIKTYFPSIKIIGLTNCSTNLFLMNMISAGASAFLAKNISTEKLLNTIYNVYENNLQFNDEEHLLSNHQMYFHVHKKTRSRFDFDLTKREIEILKLTCKQYSTIEIAEKLNLSIRTIEGHKSNIFQKTTCKNVVSLVMYAIQNQYVALEELF